MASRAEEGAAHNGRDSLAVDIVEAVGEERDDSEVESVETSESEGGDAGEAGEDEALPPPRRCVYRVPAYLKNVNSEAYEPRVVSFGPYHHGKLHLQPMEEHKLRSLDRVLGRCGKPLESFLAAAEEVVQELMDAYEQLGVEWRNDQQPRFLRMMVVDGFFMLEVARAFPDGKLKEDYPIIPHDPVFSHHGALHTVPYIRWDMVLMENQLPLFLLKKLAAVETDSTLDDGFINKLLHDVWFVTEAKAIPSRQLWLHPLDVYRSELIAVYRGEPIAVGRVPMSPSEEVTSIPSSDPYLGLTATELSESGVVFVGNGRAGIRFDHGRLTLPPFSAADFTESELLNLMAFERLHVGAGSEVLSHISFMCVIVRSGRDVALLRSRGIVYNIARGGDKAVADMFDRLGTGIWPILKTDHTDVLFRMHEYCGHRRRRWRRYVVHKYFSIPGTGYSLAAALLLLGLTIAQVVYAALQYHDSPS